MADVDQLLKTSVEELDRLLNAKNVMGAPIEKDGVTIIPLVSYGFGFGAGGGADQKKGQGAGTGGAGGIKPVGAIIIDKNGARVEGVKGAVTNLVEAISEVTTRAIDKSIAANKDTATG
jgi:uncharacterized spore protein YtfJ